MGRGRLYTPVPEVNPELSTRHRYDGAVVARSVRATVIFHAAGRVLPPVRGAFVQFVPDDGAREPVQITRPGRYNPAWHEPYARYFAAVQALRAKILVQTIDSTKLQRTLRQQGQLLKTNGTARFGSEKTR